MRYRELIDEKKKKRKKTKYARIGGWYGYGIIDSSDGDGGGGGVEEAAQLGAQDKVSNISPVLTSKKPKKQKQLMNKFFGSS